MSNQQIQKAYEAERKIIKQTIQENDGPNSVFDAINLHHSRTDEAKGSIETYSKVETSCKKGCNYCCYFKTEVGAEEVFLIADYILNHFDKANLDTVLKKAQSNKKKISNLSTGKRIQTNIECALLKEGECSVYPVRPSTCRKMHSTDIDICKSSFDNPDDTSIQNAEVPLLSSVLLSMSSAARQGLNDAGLDSNLYDLNEVIYDALIDNKYQKRWKKGKKAFV